MVSGTSQDSKASSVLSMNIQSRGVEDLVKGGVKLVAGPRQNPYMLPAAFTGSKEQKKKCQFCDAGFYQMVSHGYDDRRLSSAPVVCLNCANVLSGLV